MITELNQDLSLSFVANAYGVDTLYSEGIKAFGPNLELLWATGNLGFGSDSSCPPAVTMDGSVVSQFGTGGFVVVNGVTGVVQWQNNNVKPRGCFTLSPDMTTMYSNSDSSGAQSQITTHDVATGLQIDASAEGSNARTGVGISSAGSDLYLTRSSGIVKYDANNLSDETFISEPFASSGKCDGRKKRLIEL